MGSDLKGYQYIMIYMATAKGNVLCECGCRFRNAQSMQRHKKSEKHQVLSHGGSAEICQQIVMLRGFITGAKNQLRKHPEGTAEWNQARGRLQRDETTLRELEATWLRGSVES